ncbi:MAG TPA: peptidylprolyl isomerase [Levilinea sp.]|nr:peptidylprolyl isomerase [Levilinea sp.]
MRSKRTNPHVFLCIIILTALALLTGCNAVPEQPAVVPPVDTPVQRPGEIEQPVAQPVVLTPTKPDLPVAARVNGEGILLSEYVAELQRYASAMEEMGKTVDPEVQRQMVLDELVDQVLLAQAANAAGFSMDDAALEARIAELGDAQALAEWQSQHGYDADSFRIALRRQAAAAYQRDQIAARVPDAVEQVRARQILVFDQALAERLHNRLEGGADFALVVRQIDPTGGELGWFPRGYLTQPEIEAAAFNLQPGQYSEVIQTSFGFHIVQTISRDALHPVSAEVRRFLQYQALRSWLEEQRSRSEIEVLLPE